MESRKLLVFGHFDLLKNVPFTWFKLTLEIFAVEQEPRGFIGFPMGSRAWRRGPVSYALLPSAPSWIPASLYLKPVPQDS